MYSLEFCTQIFSVKLLHALPLIFMELLLYNRYNIIKHSFIFIFIVVIHLKFCQKKEKKKERKQLKILIFLYMYVFKKY